jgi:hypothetical protein
MSAAAVALVVASCVFGGSLLAMYAARALPDSHLSADARDVIKVGMALIATLVALVLGLMIATAKGTYDAQSAGVRQLSANVLLLDRSLAEYGPEAQQPRDLLRQAAELMLQRLWPADDSAPVSLVIDTGGQLRMIFSALARKRRAALVFRRSDAPERTAGPSGRASRGRQRSPIISSRSR